MPQRQSTASHSVRCWCAGSVPSPSGSAAASSQAVCAHHVSVGSVCCNRLSFQQKTRVLTFLHTGMCLATWPHGVGDRWVHASFHSCLTAGLQSQGHTQFSGTLVICWAASFRWDCCRTEEAGMLGSLQPQSPFIPLQAILSSCLQPRARLLGDMWLSSAGSFTESHSKPGQVLASPYVVCNTRVATHPAVTDPQPQWFPLEFADVS